MNIHAYWYCEKMFYLFNFNCKMPVSLIRDKANYKLSENVGTYNHGCVYTCTGGGTTHWVHSLIWPDIPSVPYYSDWTILQNWLCLSYTNSHFPSINNVVFTQIWLGKYLTECEHCNLGHHKQFLLFWKHYTCISRKVAVQRVHMLSSHKL